MHFAKIFSTSIILAGSAYAQESSSTSSAAPSGTSSAAGGMMTVHVIQASDASGALTFSPNSIQANAGDMVQWQFYQMNHSVVMSNFEQPCTPIPQSDPATQQKAFFSGFMPVSSAADNGRLTFTYQVKDTQPIWYYCATGKHCQEGMVGVINPPTNSQNTLQAYAAAAKNVQNSQSPNGASASGGTAASGGVPSATGSAGAQQSGNAASSNLRDAAKQGFVGMAVAGVAAFVML